MIDNSLGAVEGKSFVAVGNTPLVIGRRVVGETYQVSQDPQVHPSRNDAQAARFEKKTGSFLIETSIALV